MMRLIKRLKTLENRAGVNQPARVRMWGEEVEARIDRIMARPGHADFRMGMWGQVYDKDGRLIEDVKGLRDDEEIARCE
mgnify:CR=1 FL=1